MKGALATLVVVGALAAAVGCGSSSDDSETANATQQWADGVCEAIVTWQTTIELTVDSATSNPSRASLETAANDAREATREFAQTLDDLGAPETESGQEAQESLEQLSTDLGDDVSTIQTTLESVSSVAGVRGAISTIAATLSSMGSAVDSTFNDLQGLDASDELSRAFEDADACQDLRNSP